MTNCKKNISKTKFSIDLLLRSYYLVNIKKSNLLTEYYFLPESVSLFLWVDLKSRFQMQDGSPWAKIFQIVTNKKNILQFNAY